MKVTALIPDDLVLEVRKLSRGKNLTESLVVALREWSRTQKLRGLVDRVRQKPLAFSNGFSAQSIRRLNRNP